MTKRHEGKTAVISGAASGIGQASAVRLAEEGARIVIADRDNAEETLALIEGVGGQAIAVRCDVSDPASVTALKEEVEKKGGLCDILVNNAGIYPVQTFDEITFDDWRRVLSVNLDSMFLMTKAFADGMRQKGWGRIVNIASDTVSLTVPDFVHYITSKAGVIGFTRSLATEFGQDGVTVNAIAPGLTRTPGTAVRREIPGAMTTAQLFDLMADMQSIKRNEQTSDLVGAVSFLASDDAGFITGQTLYVNGGLTRTT
jgi:NAD(P)-dependent dehydrogenase (short-subunit alcohol dehydrogenase family)